MTTIDELTLGNISPSFGLANGTIGGSGGMGIATNIYGEQSDVPKGMSKCLECDVPTTNKYMCNMCMDKEKRGLLKEEPVLEPDYTVSFTVGGFASCIPNPNPSYMYTSNVPVKPRPVVPNSRDYTFVKDDFDYKVTAYCDREYTYEMVVEGPEKLSDVDMSFFRTNYDTVDITRSGFINRVSMIKCTKTVS